MRSDNPQFPSFPGRQVRRSGAWRSGREPVGVWGAESAVWDDLAGPGFRPGLYIAVRSDRMGT